LEKQTFACVLRRRTETRKIESGKKVRNEFLFCNGPELVAEELFVIPACFKRESTFAHPYGCPITAFGHDATAIFCEPLQNEFLFRTFLIFLASVFQNLLQKNAIASRGRGVV